MTDNLVWRAHSGDRCPVPAECMVRVRNVDAEALGWFKGNYHLNVVQV